MIEVRQTAAFQAWIRSLRDRSGAAIILRRIDRVAAGNLGAVRALGEGLSELKIDHGPGYRVYFVRRGSALIVLLCGGDKDSQTRDIALARALSREN